MNTPESISHWLLEAEGLHKSFNDHVVLRGASLRVPRGSLVSVLGRSGAGKSVLLKCLANLTAHDAGTIRFAGQELKPGDRPAWHTFRRRCSFLFQHNALFDSLTALENVALPLEQTTNLTRKEIREQCLDALRQLELEAYAHHYPGQLSGGMQKRLALARALVTRPELVLFDEPTAGLDPLRRNVVFTMIARYQQQFNFTALIVTHDVPEALMASDRVALLDRGAMCFEGTPDEFNASAEPAVTAFRDSLHRLQEVLSSLKRGTTLPIDNE